MRGLNLYLINGMYWITVSLYLPFISMYFSQKGMNSMQVGVLSALLPAASLVVQPLWAAIADRTGKRRRVLILLSVCCAAAVLLFPGLDTFPGILGAAACYSLFNSAVLPVCDALVVNQAQEREINFARVRMCGTISYAAVVLGMGFYLKQHMNLMFYGNSVCFLVLALLCMTLPGDGGAGENRTAENLAAEYIEPNKPLKKNAGKSRIFRSNEVYLILLFAFAMQFGINYYSAFLGVYLLELGYSQSLLGVLNCISALSEIPVLLLIHRLSRRYKETVLLTAAVLCMALRLVLLSVGNVALMAAAQLLQGPSYMVCYFVCVTYISRMVMPGKISQGQSALAFVQMGLGSLSGSLLGGVLASSCGIKNGFLIVAFLLLAVTAAAGAFSVGRGRKR